VAGRWYGRDQTPCGNFLVINRICSVSILCTINHARRVFTIDELFDKMKSNEHACRTWQQQQQQQLASSNKEEAI